MAKQENKITFGQSNLDNDLKPNSYLPRILEHRPQKDVSIIYSDNLTQLELIQTVETGIRKTKDGKTGTTKRIIFEQKTHIARTQIKDDLGVKKTIFKRVPIEHNSNVLKLSVEPDPIIDLKPNDDYLGAFKTKEIV